MAEVKSSNQYAIKLDSIKDAIDDIREGKVLQNTQVGYDGAEVSARQNWIKKHKPRVYEKMMQFPEKLANS